MRIPFQINSDGNELLGILHIANRQQEIPVVIITCYGLNGTRVEQHRMSVKFGEMCEGNAINLIRFDYTNVGVSEGDFFFTTISERIRNIVDVYSFIKGCFNCEISVFLIGFSDGAKIAIQAKEYIEDFEGLICWNPIINVPQVLETSSAETTIKEKLKIHKKYRKPYKQLFGVALNTNIIKEIETDISVDKLDNGYKKLFVFGEKDRFTKHIRAFIENKNYIDCSIVVI